MSKRMTYADYIQQFDTGLFTKVNEIEPFEWNELYSPEQLDILFLFQHGNKPISPSLKNVDLELLAKMVHTAYNKVWKDLYTIFTVEQDRMVGETYRITGTNQSKKSERDEGTKETQRKESAFNETELSVIDGTDDISLTEREQTDDRTHERIRVDYETMRKQLQALETDFFTDTILKQTSNLILLKIYN